MILTSAELASGSAELRSGSAELGSAPAELQIPGKFIKILLKSSRSSLRAGSETRRSSLGSSAGLGPALARRSRARPPKKSILGAKNDQKMRPPISIDSNSRNLNLFELDADLDFCHPNGTFECQSFATQVGVHLSALDPWATGSIGRLRPKVCNRKVLG